MTQSFSLGRWIVVTIAQQCKCTQCHGTVQLKMAKMKIFKFLIIVTTIIYKIIFKRVLLVIESIIKSDKYMLIHAQVDLFLLWKLVNFSGCSPCYHQVHDFLYWAYVPFLSPAGTSPWSFSATPSAHSNLCLTSPGTGIFGWWVPSHSNPTRPSSLPLYQYSPLLSSKTPQACQHTL